MSHAISVNQLAKQLNDTVVIDCRFNLMDPEQGHGLYNDSHITGAHYLHLEDDLSSAVGQHGGRHPLPDIQVLVSTLQGIGVSNDGPVVVYDDNRQAFASRLWWLLRYLGHEQVSVLDGGFAAWQAAGLASDAITPSRLEGGQFVPQIDESQLFTLAQVRECAAGRGLATLVDAREAPRYRGEVEPIDPVAGHIPGAINMPWVDVCDEQNMLRPVEWHKQRWQAYADQPLAVYCGSGVTACVDLLSLALAGHDHAQLYAGSWSDWCSYPEHEIARA
ncbi:MAG: sulfurtransferase [Pseudomonadales bacterium]